MKTTELITLTAFAFLLSLPLHAQFNTIGTFNSKHIKTNNPPKSNETLTDSKDIIINSPHKVLFAPVLPPKRKKRKEIFLAECQRIFY